MEFNGTFELDGVTVEEAWLALSDPVLIRQALPGCQFLTRVDDPDDVDFDALTESATPDDELPPVLPEADPETVAERAFQTGETYAALMEVGVGSVKPTFRTLVTVETRELPEMIATGEGSASNSSFEMRSGMTLSESEDGVTIEWWSESDVFGRVAQMGQRVLNPVANQVVNRFFKKVQGQLSELDEADSGLRDRIRGLL
ncbi:MAG: SRPBCC domain-containing protein [Halobacteriales archaeon]|nr:SRPBCC domain-containing protein [Halobacteriales archaeon]